MADCGLDREYNIEIMRGWVEALLKGNDAESHEFVYSLLLTIGDTWAAEKFLDLVPSDIHDYPYRIACFLIRIGEPAVVPLKRYVETCEAYNVGFALDVLVQICGEDI